MASNNTTLPYDSVVREAAPRFLACLLNWGLYGALSVQVYWYYVAFPKDRWFPKTIVYGTYVLDTVQTILVTRDVFNPYARHFGDRTMLDTVQLEWLSVPVLTSIISCAVQMYYGFRLNVLSRSKGIMLFVCVLAVSQTIAGLVTGGTSVTKGLMFSQFHRATNVALPIWLAGNVICDVVIAVCMVYLLLRRDTGVAETRTLITKLVRIIVEGGTLTASASLLALILYAAIPHREYFTAIATVLGKLYSNSLLAIFNSRSKFAGNHSWKIDPLYLSFKPDLRATPPERPIKVLLKELRKAADALGGIHVEQEVCVTSDDRKSRPEVVDEGDLGSREFVVDGTDVLSVTQDGSTKKSQGLV